MVNANRKFKCLDCGWMSSEFGHRRYIDREKLSKAQKELNTHYEEEHPTYKKYEHWNIRVIFTEPPRIDIK